MARLSVFLSGLFCGCGHGWQYLRFKHIMHPKFLRAFPLVRDFGYITGQNLIAGWWCGVHNASYADFKG